MMPLFSRPLWVTIVLLVASGAAATKVMPAALHHETIWTGRPDGFVVDWRADGFSVTRAGKEVLSIGAIATREWNYLRENARSRALKFDKTDALLSSVGPFLSVQEGSFCDCDGK